MVSRFCESNLNNPKCKVINCAAEEFIALLSFPPHLFVNVSVSLFLSLDLGSEQARVNRYTFVAECVWFVQCLCGCVVHTQAHTQTQRVTGQDGKGQRDEFRNDRKQ